ncbi:hypothetical protein D3C80_2050570 [compost metagenome]
MLGQGRLRQADQRQQVSDLPFAAADLAQDHQAVFVGQGFQQPGGVARIGLKAFQSDGVQVDHADQYMSTC